MPLRDYNYFLLHNIEAAGDEPNFRLLTGKCKHHIFYTIAFMILTKYWVIIKDYLEVTIYYVYSWLFHVGQPLWTILWILQADISKDYILGYWSIQIQLLIEINVVSFNNNSIISYFQFSDENWTQNILIKQLTVLNRFVLIVVFDIIIVALSEFNDIAKWMVKEKRRIHMHLLENEI